MTNNSTEKLESVFLAKFIWQYSDEPVYVRDEAE